MFKLSVERVQRGNMFTTCWDVNSGFIIKNPRPYPNSDIPYIRINKGDKMMENEIRSYILQQIIELGPPKEIKLALIYGNDEGGFGMLFGTTEKKDKVRSDFTIWWDEQIIHLERELIRMQHRTLWGPRLVEKMFKICLKYTI